jgi:hypothetical protein
MPAGQGLDVGALACVIRDSLVVHYSAAPDIGLPDRRIIAPGMPELVAADCECVIVTCSGLDRGVAPGLGTIAAQGQRAGLPTSAAGGLRHAVFAVQIWRESPEGARAPDPDDITTAGLRHMRDMGLLSQGLVDICTAVDRVLPRDSVVQPGTVNSLGPEGGLTGVQGTLAATIGILV